MKTKFLCDKKSQNTPICPVSYYCHCISGLSQVPLKLNCIYSILFFFLFFWKTECDLFSDICFCLCGGNKLVVVKTKLHSFVVLASKKCYYLRFEKTEKCFDSSTTFHTFFLLYGFFFSKLKIVKTTNQAIH